MPLTAVDAVERAPYSTSPVGAEDAAGQRRRLLANGMLVLVLLSLAALRFCPASASRFYPQCPVHQYLGLLCPGCGATRAVAALLHGQLNQAVRFNALAVIMLPFALAIGVQCYCRALQPGRFQCPQLSPAAACCLLVASSIFAIVRNLS